MKARFFLQTACVVFTVAVAIRPAAAENPRVLLVHAGSGDSLTPHLVDELVAAGFTIEIVPAGEFEPKTLATARGARAIIHVEPATHTIDLWTDTKNASTHILEKPEERGDLATLSLRAVEVLRGQLLANPAPIKEYGPDEPRPVPSNGPILLPPEKKPLVAPVRPKEPKRIPHLRDAGNESGRIWLHIAPSALIHPASGGIRSGGSVLFGLRWMFLPRFGLDIIGSAPILPSTVASPVGNVNVAASALLAGGFADVYRPTPRLNFGLGAGIGAGLFHHYGQPQTSGIEARDGNVAYALPYVKTSVGWAITRQLSVRADLLTAVATPRPMLRLPGRTSDVPFGQPLLMIGLGLDLKLQ